MIVWEKGKQWFGIIVLDNKSKKHVECCKSNNPDETVQDVIFLFLNMWLLKGSIV